VTTTLKDEQGLADRATTDVKITGNLQLLNAFSRTHGTRNDLLPKVLGDLFRETFRRLESHSVLLIPFFEAVAV